MRPYIGICDVANADQASHFVEQIPPDFSHDVMIGVMMSRKTLYGLPTKWSEIFPKKETIKDIFIPDRRALNTIHYADYDVGTSRDTHLATTLSHVASYGGAHLNAIQLDMIWPSRHELAFFRRISGIPIVLQVGSNAMAECGNDPIEVARRLETYGDSIDCVLFDKSMGEGKGMDAALLSTFLGAMVADCPHLLPAVAGGLGPTSMYPVEPLWRAYHNLSMDMQSKVRPSGDKKDPIDKEMAAEALRMAVRIKQSFS